jgi:uridylate kinase
MPKTIVLSLGGSLIVPNDVDHMFLRQFVSLIRRYTKKGYKFAIICGGGSIARKYQQAALKVAKLDNDALDWIGIEATKMNAFLLRQLFGNHAHDAIIYDPSRKIAFGGKHVLIASGWKPGWSTDYDAILIAKQLKIDTVVNMSNIDYVYSSDPRKNRHANPIAALCWRHYRRMFSSTWKAGMNLPFDPIAAKAAEKGKIAVYIMGKNLSNFENFLKGKQPKGTVIR